MVFQKIELSKEIEENLKRSSGKCVICDQLIGEEGFIIHYLKCSTELQTFCKSLVSHLVHSGEHEEIEEEETEEETEEEVLEEEENENVEKLIEHTEELIIGDPMTPPTCTPYEEEKEVLVPVPSFHPHANISPPEYTNNNNWKPSIFAPPPVKPVDKIENTYEINESSNDNFDAAFKYEYYKGEINRKLVPGQFWCMIEAKWFRRWESGAYLKSDLGPINNASLVYNKQKIPYTYFQDDADLGCKIVPNLRSDAYVFIPENVFQELIDFYNAGQCERIRRKVQVDRSLKEFIDARVPYTVHLLYKEKEGKSYFYEHEPISVALTRFCRHLEISNQKTYSLFDYDLLRNQKSAEIPTYHLVNNIILPDQTLLLEDLNLDTKYPTVDALTFDHNQNGQNQPNYFYYNNNNNNQPNGSNKNY